MKKKVLSGYLLLSNGLINALKNQPYDLGPSI